MRLTPEETTAVLAQARHLERIGGHLTQGELLALDLADALEAAYAALREYGPKCRCRKPAVARDEWERRFVCQEHTPVVDGAIPDNCPALTHADALRRAQRGGKER